MEFFVPAADAPERAEAVWEATRKFAHENLGWEIGDRRIRRLRYVHDGEDLTAEVGQPDPRSGEVVLVILESNAYLLCTGNRGVLRGEPILVGLGGVYEITDFEQAPPEKAS